MSTNPYDVLDPIWCHLPTTKHYLVDLLWQHSQDLSRDHLVSFQWSGAQKHARNFVLLHTFQPITIQHDSQHSQAVKFDNLQYNMMGWCYDCPTVWWYKYYFDRLGIIQWDSGSVTFQTVHYRITLKIKCHFFTHFFAKCLKENKKANSLLTVWYILRPNQQATVSLNYFQTIKIIIGPSDGGTIILSSHCIILKWRLSDLCCHW